MHAVLAGSKVIQLFHAEISAANWKIKTFPAFKLSDVIFIMLINVKMPTIVGILT